MTQDDQNKPEMTEVDDLTRFLDEDFGTEEVDLFEFTSGEEESPLTQLKAIILGLDWEITDEALQDLADEIEHLRYLEQFEHDKVTQVYLQALDKIGNYVLTEGAYAHANAIKLLLSLFYDFEKIISSEIITGAEITALLKADVRKFKILQYQIAQKHGAAVPEATAAAAELPLTDHKTLLDIHAAILELDWEVTDEGLERLSEHLEVLKDQFADNRYIQIIARGLVTLNNYINEERARTHPEAFSLLHHFFEALETLVDDKELDDENSQKILIKCVNRLNTLKSLITKTPEELSEKEVSAISGEGEVEEAVVEEATPEEPVGLEKPASEEPAFKPPAADEDEYEDELDVELPVDETGEVAPALVDSGEESGFAEPETEEEAPPEELAEKLDFFFGDDEETPPPPPEEEVAIETPAEETVPETPVAEVEEKVTDESPAAEIEGLTPSSAVQDEEDDVLDVELPVDETGEVAPALSDSDEEGGFGEAEDIEAPPEELEDKLQSFFGDDEETFAPEAVEEAVAKKKEEEEEIAVTEQKIKEEEEEILSVAPALAGEPEEAGFSADDEEAEGPPEELEDKLAFFFGEDEAEEPEAEVPTEEEAPTLEEEAPEVLFEEEEPAPTEEEEAPEALFEEEEPVPATEEEAPETLFEEDEEEELLLTPALAVEEEEVAEPSLFEETAEITSPDDLSATIEKLKVEFQEKEKTMLNEIASLKEEIESLRSQLK